MRRILLTSAAVLAASASCAQAQGQANPSQGQLVAPYGAGPAANNNNNAWGIANTKSGSREAGSNSTMFAPNTDAVPAPGTIVIRLNGRVDVELSANFTSVDRGLNANGTPNGFKLNPLGVNSLMRLYPGFDGMSANGVRYGAAIELREDFGAADRTFANTTTGGTANSPSATSSAETVFVRRAFTYLASDKAGIVRFGQADGVIGLFDNCIFTTQCWDAGIQGLNASSGFTASAPAGAAGVPFVWLTGAGAEYANNKIVYLSPQFLGFDFGVQYAPNMGNSFQNEGLSAGCNQAAATCINVSSGNDPTRWLNQVGVGLRYQQTFGPVDVKAFGFYETAGKENLTTSAYTTPAQARAGTVIGGVTSGAQTLRYDNLSFYNAGLAVTLANITLAADYIGGAVNGQLSMRPTGGVPTNAVMTGITYAKGPLTLGAQVGIIDTQGDARLTGVSQRHESEIGLGGAYRLAPGLQLVAEYAYVQRHQGGFDFNQNALGNAGGGPGTVTRDAKGQGFLFATVLTW
jgi:hypothetical protein